jgi:hypothetical protein
MSWHRCGVMVAAAPILMAASASVRLQMSATFLARRPHGLVALVLGLMRKVSLGSRVSISPTPAIREGGEPTRREALVSSRTRSEGPLRCRGGSPHNLAWQLMPLLRSSSKRRRMECGMRSARCNRSSSRSPICWSQFAVASRLGFLQACSVFSSRARATNGLLPHKHP